MGLYTCINTCEYIRTEIIAWCNLTLLATQKSFMWAERIEPYKELKKMWNLEPEHKKWGIQLSALLEQKMKKTNEHNA